MSSKLYKGMCSIKAVFFFFFFFSDLRASKWGTDQKLFKTTEQKSFIKKCVLSKLYPSYFSSFFFLDLRTSKWRTDQKAQQSYWTATSTKQKICFNQVLLLLLLLLFSPSSSSSPLDPRTSNLRISQKLCKVFKLVLQATGNSI